MILKCLQLVCPHNFILTFDHLAKHKGTRDSRLKIPVGYRDDIVHFGHWSLGVFWREEERKSLRPSVAANCVEKFFWKGLSCELEVVLVSSVL